MLFSSTTSTPQSFSEVGALFEYEKLPTCVLKMILVSLGTTNVLKFFSIDECAVT
jgi:hypothetical protein